MPDGADLVHRRLEARARQELASVDNGVAFAFGASEPTPAEIARLSTRLARLRDDRLLFNETAGSAVTTAGGSNYLAIFLAVIVFVGFGFILTSIFSSRPPRRGFPVGPPRYGQHMDVMPNHDALSRKVRSALRVLENRATRRPAAAPTRPV